MIENGIVIGIKPDRIQIRLETSDHCEGCNLCNVMGKGGMVMDLPPRPDVRNGDKVQVEILKKISSGGSIYQQFHRDHNKNFHALEERYGSVSDGIIEAVRWIKIGTIAGLGMGAILIYVIYTL